LSEFSSAGALLDSYGTKFDEGFSMAIAAAAAKPVVTKPAPAKPAIDWAAVIADPRFQKLHRRKQAFLTGLMLFSVFYYFLLPVGAAYFQELFKIKVWGVINFGLVFALSEFLVAWFIAFYYSRRAGADFDMLAREIAADYEHRGRA
jgi:uncharacterized membrane protein (DUF485 family)